MQKVFTWVLAFSLLVGGAYQAGQMWGKKRDALSALKSKEVDNGFTPSPYPLEKRSFVVFIYGYNNGAFVQKTLRSVFSQAYDAYRVVYVDDASTDGSFEAANDAIYMSKEMLRVTAVQNEEHLGQLANLVRVVEGAQDDEIIVVLNGEDWLAHEWVLSSLNQYYADSDLWMTYGQYCDFPSFKKGGARSLKRGELDHLREAPFAAGHLKTFYAKLFKQIAPEHLGYQGGFFPAAFDLAIMLPMLEMAKEHFQFLPEVLYIANRHPNMQIDPQIQASCEQIIRAFKPCEPLASLHFSEEE